MAQAGSATHAKGCLGTRELCSGQDTPDRQQKHPCVHRGMRRGAVGENSRRLQNKKVSDIPVLHRSESESATQVWPGYLHQPPKAAKHPPATTGGIRTEPSLKDETGGTGVLTK